MQPDYYDYPITGCDSEGDIMIGRRYSLFFEFRIALCWKYPGLYVPPLPSKKVGGNKDDFTILERKHFLGLFLLECTQLKYIAQSVEIQTFLKSTGDVKKELEKLQVKSKTDDRIAAYRACCGINEVSLFSMLIYWVTESWRIRYRIVFWGD